MYVNSLIKWAKNKRQRKKDAKAVSKEIIEDKDDSSGGEGGCLVPSEDSYSNSKDLKIKEEELDIDLEKKKTKKRDKDKDKDKERKKKNAGPMHFTANSEPRALDVIGDLEPSIFNECKEKMRPVKKALKALDNPDQSLGPQEQVNHTRQCLVQIGDQINKCLTEYKDLDTIKKWRSNLWYFVSKFTEYDPKKLYKLYKHAIKKLKPDKEDKEPAKPEGNGTQKKRKSEDDSVDTVKKVTRVNIDDEKKITEADRQKPNIDAGSHRGGPEPTPLGNSDRWHGHQRYSSGDHKRDNREKYDYQRSNYRDKERERDGGDRERDRERDRDRDRNSRDRTSDSRRYRNSQGSGNYGSGNYNSNFSYENPVYNNSRDRYPPNSTGFHDTWRRDNKDYRRDRYSHSANS